MNILVTGASSGIGMKLCKALIYDGDRVFGVARRRVAGEKFKYLSIDFSKESAWQKLIRSLKRDKFTPDVVVFNAAVLKGDLKEVLKVNFLSIIEGVEELMKNFKSCHFIAISSTAALRGSGVELLGYASSKAALSIAFESLYQKFKKSKYKFSLVYFGPVRGGMSPFKDKTPFQLSLEQAVLTIKKAIREKSPAYYNPWWVFYMLRLIRILPANLDFVFFSLLERIYQKNRKL